MKHVMTKKIRKIGFYSKIIVLLLLIGAAGLTLNIPHSRAAADSTVYVDPASNSVDLNDSFSVDAKINPNTNQVSAIELHIVFDYTKLRLDTITPNTASGAFPETLTPASINNSAGTASITLGSGSSDWVTTDIVIATLSFTTIGSGTSNIALTGTQAAAHGEGGTDVITTRTSGSVIVNSLPTEIGVFRNGAWYLDMNGNGIWEGSTDTAKSFGMTGDTPIVGDWDGNGTTEIGVFRNGAWYLDMNGNGIWEGSTDTAKSFGMTGDKAIPGKW
jgi:hypothetical protein